MLREQAATGHMGLVCIFEKDKCSHQLILLRGFNIFAKNVSTSSYEDCIQYWVYLLHYIEIFI